MPGANERRFALDERNRLALHVRTHQRAVGVVVFEKRNQAGSHGNELLRRNVHVVDFIAALRTKLPSLPAVDQLGRNLEALVSETLACATTVLIFFPSGR